MIAGMEQTSLPNGGRRRSQKLSTKWYQSKLKIRAQRLPEGPPTSLYMKHNLLHFEMLREEVSLEGLRPYLHLTWCQSTHVFVLHPILSLASCMLNKVVYVVSELFGEPVHKQASKASKPRQQARQQAIELTRSKGY